MKRVLITGANSYVGTNVEKWLMREPDKYYVETLDMMNPNWKEFDFSKFDVVFHVAGIVHIKETKENKIKYYEINRDMAFDLARKAKESGIKHFIFMSTMSVYGLEKGVIDKGTFLKPKNAYGDSKLQAEKLILSIKTDKYKVTVLRPPLIYGPESIGNYSELSKFVKKFKVFPKINNRRSFIFIDHLSEFIKNVISMELEGVFHPQNKYIVSTTNMVSCINMTTPYRIFISVIFNPILLLSFIKKISKIFGSLYYDFNLYDEPEKSLIELSSIYDFDVTIKLSETGLS